MGFGIAVRKIYFASSKKVRIFAVANRKQWFAGKDAFFALFRVRETGHFTEEILGIRVR